MNNPHVSEWFSERQRRSAAQSRVALNGATLGVRPGIIEPQRGSGLSRNSRWSRAGQNPFRVHEFSRTVSQGSRFAPTLGWRTESLWDSGGRQDSLFFLTRGAAETVFNVVVQDEIQLLRREPVMLRKHRVDYLNNPSCPAELFRRQRRFVM